METPFTKTLALQEISRLKQVVTNKFGTDTALMGCVETLESVVSRRPVGRTEPTTEER